MAYFREFSDVAHQLNPVPVFFDIGTDFLNCEHRWLVHG